MTTNVPTEAQFLKDVRDHKMIVVLDNGLHRHLRFRADKNSFNQWFEIVTWDQCLTVHGDMGTYVFSRVEDMLTFFRGKKINPDYWAEKIQSDSKFGNGSRTFSIDTYRKDVHSHLEGYALNKKKLKSIKEALESDVFSLEFETELRNALYDFEHEGFRFEESGMISGMDWTYHYIWCLYAIVWAIEQYDAFKTPKEKAA
jgi:hypothetical protein